MIDYNSYTNMSGKDLEKIVTHIKNIQHKRYDLFDLAFKNADIESFTSLLPHINKDLVEKSFMGYLEHFDGTEKNIDFYLFLKQNPLTQNLDLTVLERSLCSNYATTEILEKIKNSNPIIFEHLKKFSFQYHDLELINYLHKNNLIDFEGLKTIPYISNTIFSYMVEKNMFKIFEDIPFHTWFPLFNDDNLCQLRTHFNLDKFNYEEMYSKTNSFIMRSYLKNVIKNQTPSILENFNITPFFVIDFSKSIDKIEDSTISIPFIMKMYELINDCATELQEELFIDLKSYVQKPANKNLLEKMEFNFKLSLKLPEKTNTIASAKNKI